MKELSKEEATSFLAALYYGEHHIPEPIKQAGYGWEMPLKYGSLSTVDYNGLTRLVCLSHDRCIRADIQVRGLKMFLMLHKRSREGSFTESIPALEDHIKTIRESKYYSGEINK